MNTEDVPTRTASVVAVVPQLHEAIWGRFFLLASVEALGESAVILEGKRIKNFLGAIEKYKKLYDQAAMDVLDDTNRR